VIIQLLRGRASAKRVELTLRGSAYEIRVWKVAS
jgi:hypothetical protein